MFCLISLIKKSLEVHYKAKQNSNQIKVLLLWHDPAQMLTPALHSATYILILDTTTFGKEETLHKTPAFSFVP
jgi:hypothetical protein